MNITRRDFVAGSTALVVAATAHGQQASSTLDNTIVATTHGQVRGRIVDGMREFKGIPYAGSVSGARRFLPALPPESWAGVRDAFDFGPMAPQAVMKLPAPVGPATSSPISEDNCLTVNVWSPAKPGRRRPVLVNIHGGAYIVGSGTLNETIAPTVALEHDLVLVTLNYRLGVLGFLHLADIAGDAYSYSGSIGIADQIMALQWVRDNIAAFGGDPHQVTIAGQSAGGVSVMNLLNAPTARGLFHRAVDEYGPLGEGNTPTQATALALRYLGKLGLDRSNWRQILEMPIEKLLAAQNALGDPMGILRGAKLWGPVNDGKFLPPDPSAALRDRKSRVPVIVGCDYDHMAMLGKLMPALMPGNEPGVLESWLEPLLHTRTDAVVAHFRQRYPDASQANLLVKIIGELFRSSMINLAEAREHTGSPVWMYLAMPGKPLGVPAQRLAAFAASGNPNPPGAVEWPHYRSTNRATLVIDNSQYIEQDPFGPDRAILAGIPYGV